MIISDFIRSITDSFEMAYDNAFGLDYYFPVVFLSVLLCLMFFAIILRLLFGLFRFISGGGRFG